MSDPLKHTDGAERRKYAVIVAGGKGTRMGAAEPKQYLPLQGKPVLYHTLRAFLNAYTDIRIILVHAPGDLRRVHRVLDHFPGRNQSIMLARGGETRFHSVKNGLQRVEEPAVVFVHDGVRPLVSTGLIHACCMQALAKGSAVPAVKLKESIRRVENDHSFSVDREAFRAIQTPQTFLSDILLPAFDRPYESTFTDEAGVVERSGRPVYLIPGEEDNIKITCPADLQLAAQLLSAKGA